jgi:hypothetical protein
MSQNPALKAIYGFGTLHKEELPAKVNSDWDWQFDTQNYGKKLDTITWSSLKERIGFKESFSDLDDNIEHARAYTAHYGMQKYVVIKTKVGIEQTIMAQSNGFLMMDPIKISNIGEHIKIMKSLQNSELESKINSFSDKPIEKIILIALLALLKNVEAYTMDMTNMI